MVSVNLLRVPYSFSTPTRTPTTESTTSYPLSRTQDVHRTVGRFVTRMCVDVTRDPRTGMTQKVGYSTNVDAVLKPVGRGGVPKQVFGGAATVVGVGRRTSTQRSRGRL